MSDVSLRPAAPADVEALARVAHDSFHEAFASIMSPAALAQRPLAFFVERFSSQWPDLVAALDGKRIVGFSLVRNGHIDMLFIAPDAQARGVGKVLLEDAEAGGARTLECFRDNHLARAFYEKHGWRLTSSLRRTFCGEEYDFVTYAKGA
ncbi:MAG: GNAT family N-acetyltransferase [Alphaproteobacteria bacterium]|nr:GNAT family N-acetyltransferase [Alphaproteobacteria bacterium]